MNDRQFFALSMPARSQAESTGTDYQDIVRSPSGAIVLTVLACEVYQQHPRWHAVAMVLDPQSKRIAPLEMIPLRLHKELRTIVAKICIGIGLDPSEIHPQKLGWHCYRLCTVDEIGKIPEPPSELATAPPEPLIVRPDGGHTELDVQGFKVAELIKPADVVLGNPPPAEPEKE